MSRNPAARLQVIAPPSSGESWTDRVRYAAPSAMHDISCRQKASKGDVGYRVRRGWSARDRLLPISRVIRSIRGHDRRVVSPLVLSIKIGTFYTLCRPALLALPPRHRCRCGTRSMDGRAILADPGPSGSMIAKARECGSSMPIGGSGREDVPYIAFRRTSLS